MRSGFIRHLDRFVRSSYSVWQIASLLCVSVLLTGCPKPIAPGHYEGNLVKVTHDEPGEPKAVGLDVHYVDDMALIEVKDSKEKRLFSIEIEKHESHEIDFHAPGIIPGRFVLIRYKPETASKSGQSEIERCYLSDGETHIKVCYNDNEFTLKIWNLKKRDALVLTANSFSKLEEDDELEQGRTIKLSEAVNLGMTQNFDAQIGLIQIIQAKGAALAAWLNLLPHFSAAFVWAGPPSFSSYIGSIPGLVPFLFPTNWTDAMKSSIEVKIKEDAYRIIRADLVATIEQLAYAFERDYRISIAHQNVLRALEEAVEEIKLSHLEPEVLKKYMEDLESVEKAVEVTKFGVDSVLDLDRYALSLALGFSNPKAIEHVIIDMEYDVFDSAVLIENEAEFAEWATKRAFEAEQIRNLIRIAELGQISMFFNWLNPGGDSKMNLGPALAGHMQVAEAQMGELILRRKQLKTVLRNTAYRVAIEYNEALRTRKTGVHFLGFGEPTYLTVLQNGLAQHSLNADSVKTEIGRYLAQVVENESNHAAFRIARSKRDRLYQRNFYKVFATDQIIPEMSVPVKPLR